MTNVETRQIERDSLFLMAEVRVDGGDQSHRIKVRNLSAGGMMAEGDVRVARGALVIVNLRHIGDVEGSVAWTHENRFGIAFVDEIDPKLARAPVGTVAPSNAPRFTRTAISQIDRARLRNI